MKSKKTRERILDASLELFNQRKASNVSTVQISAAMKISPGNLYYYFANKEDIIRCIWEERMDDKLSELLKSTDSIRTAADLLDFLERSFNYMIEYRFFYTEISTLFMNDDKLIEIYHDASINTRDTFKKLTIRLSDEGKFVKDNEVSKILAVQNAIAAASQMLERYDVYIGRGIKEEDFIGVAWIRIAALLEPVLEDEMKDEINAELAARGYKKERYLELSE